jgi:hypothetical protein
MKDGGIVGVTIKGNKGLVCFGPVTHTRGWLERRKWWQFWKPLYVEKFVTWQTMPEPQEPKK